MDFLLEWTRPPLIEQALLFLIAFAVGIIAGVINTLAGSGSLLTLPVLLLMGLSPHDANGSNRVGVFMQSVAGIVSYSRHSETRFGHWPWFVIPSAIGASGGAVTAALISARNLSYAIAAVMLLLLALLLTNPERWLREHSEINDRHRSIASILACAAIGFYGGFLQAGAGVVILALMTLGLRKTLREGNAYKLLMVPIFTVPALSVFFFYGQVQLAPGLALGFGQMLGAWYSARFAALNPHANRWIRLLLIVVTIAGLLRIGYDLQAEWTSLASGASAQASEQTK